jgi:hypothetical protein
MLTNVTQTSIAAFHSPDVQASIQNQRLRVAAFIIRETKTGKPTCRTAIWEYFARAGDAALNQKGSVARAVNELVKLSESEGVMFDGRIYEMRFVESKVYGGRLVEHFCMVLRHPKEANQLELF